MNITSTVHAIDAETLTYMPIVVAGMQAAELSTAGGQTKKQAVLDAIVAGAEVGEGIPVPQVAAIASMIDLFASIFNALGLFHRKPAAPLSPPA